MRKNSESDIARESEYDEYIKYFIRCVPFSIAYVLCGHLYENMDILKNLLWVFGFHILVEITYFRINRDTKVVSFLTWAAWSWFIYIWHIDGFKNPFYAMLPSVVMLLTLSRLCIWWNIYKVKKYGGSGTKI